MSRPTNGPQEPTRQALRGVEVEEWINGCAPEGTFLQQPPRRTCAELGVCQNRKEPCAGCASTQLAKPVTPAKSARPEPRTVWAFAISFQAWDLVGAVALVAPAYFAAGYHG